MPADWGRARTLAPAEDYSGREWACFLAEHPDTFVQMLGDVYRIYKSEEKKRLGLADPRGGRRKSSIDGNIEELFRILEPTFSSDPFPVSFPIAKGKRSLRQVAMRAKVHPGLISHWLAGRRPIGRHDLEAVAKALDVHPAYFREWRSLVVHEAVDAVFESSPNLSITALKEITR